MVGLATAQCADNGFFSLSPDVSNPQIMRYHVVNQTWMTVGNFNGMIHSGCNSIYTTSLAGDNIQKYNGYDWSGQWTNIPGSFRFRGKTYSFLDFPARSITVNPNGAGRTMVVGRDNNVVYSCFPAPTTPCS